MKKCPVSELTVLHCFFTHCTTLQSAPVYVPDQLLKAREGSPAPTGSTGETQVGVEGLHKRRILVEGLKKSWVQTWWDIFSVSATRPGLGQKVHT